MAYHSCMLAAAVSGPGLGRPARAGFGGRDFCIDRDQYCTVAQYFATTRIALLARSTPHILSLNLQRKQYRDSLHSTLSTTSIL